MGPPFEGTRGHIVWASSNKETIMVQHIGYFNDPQDIKELMGKDAKSIVKYYKKNQGNLWSSGDPDYAPIQGCRPVIIGKEKWYVRKSIDKKNLASEDNFIDLYKVV
jgi:hypothetical protein